MKIPPEDAYLKIKYILEEINGLLEKFSNQFKMRNPYVISPTLNNVIFASG